MTMNRRGFLEKAVQAGIAVSLGGSAIAAAPAATTAAVPTARVLLNVRDFGAAGDGVKTDTAALQQALDRCYVLGGGEVLVPAGQYLTGGLRLRSNVTLRLAKEAALLGSPNLADYELAQVRWEGKWIAGYTALVNASDARSVAVLGEGRIVGNPAVSVRPGPAQPLRGPVLMEFIACDGVHLEGFSTEYSHLWSVHPTLCDNVVIRGLTIRSTQTNGDGIDIDSCRHVVIDACDIATGDDCIALKSGRGEEAFVQGRPTEDVHITNCTLSGRGFACIAIGSEMSGGIRNVVVERCKITSVAKSAIFIKSRIGRGAFIENITFRDIDAAHMRAGFLAIDQITTGKQDSDPVPGLAGVSLFRNIRLENIRVSDAPRLVEAIGLHPQKPLDGFFISNVSGTATRGITLANARSVIIKNITVTGLTGPLLRLANVTGQGLEGAASFPAPAVPPFADAPAKPYALH